MKWSRDEEFTSTKIKYTGEKHWKNSILPKMESQQIHASDEEQGTIEEELNIDSNILLEEIDNKH